MHNFQDCLLDIGSRHHVQVDRAKPRCQPVFLISLVSKITQTLGKFSVIFPLQHDIQSRVSGGGHEVGKVQLELDVDKLDIGRTTVRNAPILDRQKN